MANQLNSSSVDKLKAAVRNGNVNTSPDWSFTSEDMDKLRGGDEGDNWDRVEDAHLAVETDAEPQTQARFAYPVAKLDGDSLVVYRSGTIAAKQRAAAEGDSSIENAADNLLSMIDDEKEDNSQEDFAETLHNLTNVEIFKSGIWNETKFTDEDLDEIAANFNRVGFQPPVKLGHTKDPSARAFGWVKNVRRVGNKLIADFVDMPERVVEAIKEKGFNAVSSEIFFNLKRNGKKFGKALAGVALLGAEVPAVDGLKPVSESLEFQDEDDVRDFQINQDDMDDKENTMSEDVQELQEKLEKYENRIAELEEKAQKAEKVDEYQQDLEEYKKKLAQLQEERRQDYVKEKAEQVQVPSLREHVRVFADLATKASKEETMHFAEGEETKEVHPENVVDNLVDKINNHSQWIFQEVSKDSGHERPEGSPDKEPGVALDEKAQERMKANNEDYSTAFQQALEENPDLAAKYAQTG